MDADPKADYPSTFSANAFACEALCETVRIMKSERLVEKARHIGSVIGKWSKGRFQGRGAAWAAELSSQKEVDAVCARCLKNGLIVMNTFQKTVKIAPPLVISMKDLETGLDILQEAMNG